MIAVNGGVQVRWEGVSKWGDVCSVNGGDGERLLSKLSIKPFLENTDRGSCNDGNRVLIPVFHNPHRKCPLGYNEYGSEIELA